MSYQDALDFIGRSMQYGSRLGLERIARLCELLGNPQDGAPAVHVAGTNGKGSISTMIASILSAAGYKTGLYTSPYIEDARECIRIDGAPISREAFAGVASDVRKAAERMAGEGAPPTEFELETAIAFLWFFRSLCDIMVIETGLGGRLDATNVLASPAVSVIASISLDHTAILGDTLGKIAYEKCGILKHGGIAVAYPIQADEAWGAIRERAEAVRNALAVPDLNEASDPVCGLDGTDVAYKGLKLRIPLIGRHQIPNAITAVEAARMLRDCRGLRISDENMAEGIRRTAIPLRQEPIHGTPLVLLDGAHNPDGLAALADTMKTLLNGRRAVAVMGMLADKAYEKSIGLIAPLCQRFIACKPANPRALPSTAAAEVARRDCPCVSVNDDYAGALGEAMSSAGQNGAVVVCGSLYLAGPMRKLLLPK